MLDRKMETQKSKVTYPGSHIKFNTSVISKNRATSLFFLIFCVQMTTILQI